VYTSSPITLTSMNIQLLNPDMTPFLNNNMDWCCLLQYQ
jgi:hypothetical protein